jgi:hypothetical protein
MPFPGECYEREVVRLMSQALEQARAELRAAGIADGPAEHAIRAMYIMICKRR